MRDAEVSHVNLMRSSLDAFRDAITPGFCRREHGPVCDQSPMSPVDGGFVPCQLREQLPEHISDDIFHHRWNVQPSWGTSGAGWTVTLSTTAKFTVECGCICPEPGEVAVIEGGTTDQGR